MGDKKTPKDISEFYKGYSKPKKNTINGLKSTELPWIGKLTVAYAEVYPSAAEMSVTGANGAQIYPINMNNATTDFTRRLKNNTNGELDDKMEAPYSKHSIIAAAISQERRSTMPEEDKVQLNTFVCLRDQQSEKSGDYLGITPLEDYLAKFVMTFNKHLTFPTMADKKTWYSLTSGWFVDNLADDLFVREDPLRGFSARTINIFYGYHLDEIRSLKEYYSEGNIKALMNDPNALLNNFHGKVKSEEVDLPTGEKSVYRYFDFSGNGGKFRYFYDLYKTRTGWNLNQYLEALWQAEHIENIEKIKHGDISNVTDGFSKIRAYLETLHPEKGTSEQQDRAEDYTK